MKCASPKVLIVGSKSSGLSRFINNKSRYGCIRAIKTIDAAATPGVFANISTIKPIMKAEVNESHFGILRRIPMTIYIYNKGVAHWNKWIWLSTNTCMRSSRTYKKIFVSVFEVIISSFLYSYVWKEFSTLIRNQQEKDLASFSCWI